MKSNGAEQHHELTSEQQQAIDLLVTGMTNSAAASAVGVNPATIGKWRKHDPWFQAELNRRRKELVEAAAQRLRALLPKALDVIEAELESGKNRLTAAIQITRLARLAEAVPSIDPADAEEIINRMVDVKCNAIAANREKYRSPDEVALDALLGPDPDQDQANEQVVRKAVLDEIDARLA